MKSELLQSADFRETVLSICSAHIPKATAFELTGADDTNDKSVLAAIITRHDHKYGWLIWVSVEPDYKVETIEPLIAAGFPELASLLLLAHENGFNHLYLDADAMCLPVTLGYPEFNW